MEKNMTALISCFARLYHYKNYKYHIYSDAYADKILSLEEYNNISKNMIDGIKYFNPSFNGNSSDALRWIVDNQLSPSVLARSIFNEKSLLTAIKLGCSEYLVYASGYDTSIYKIRDRNQNLSFFEIDRKEIIEDKKSRLISNKVDISDVNYLASDFTDSKWITILKKSNYDENRISFNSLLGITYYLSKEDFKKMIQHISEVTCDGSSILFDYQTNDDSIETNINEDLANGANEKMQSKYSYSDIVNILEENDLYIYEHLNNIDMTNSYFDSYNTINPNNKIKAPLGVNYCLAVKKTSR